jgi:hypothetical protein
MVGQARPYLAGVAAAIVPPGAPVAGMIDHVDHIVLTATDLKATIHSRGTNGCGYFIYPVTPMGLSACSTKWQVCFSVAMSFMSVDWLMTCLAPIRPATVRPCNV